ncbi:MAG: type II toxin-antitoxin system VapC family toxin [Candidatus Bathyarchaeia archaeon]
MTISNVFALLDTNVLVYAADESSPFHQRSKNLRDKGLIGQIPLCVCPQVLMEFFAIITDPRRVENPREPMEAIEEIEKYLLLKNIMKIYTREDTFQITINLLKNIVLRGRKYSMPTSGNNAFEWC